MKLCASLAGKTIEECREILGTNRPEMIEHRLDYLDETEGIEEFYNSLDVPIIATCRRSPGMAPGEQKVLLKCAIDAGATLVDIEYDSEGMEDIVSYARKKLVKIISSFHDYEQTPSLAELTALYQSMSENADIVKIVTTAATINEAHRMLELLCHTQTIPLIAFSMGQIGAFTRPLSLIYGSPFTYVSLGTPTAPGQYTLARMRELLEMLS